MRGQKKGLRNPKENKRQGILLCVLAGYILGNAVVWGTLFAVYPLLGAGGCWITGTLLHTVSVAAIAGEVTVGKYPQKGDTFTEENRKAAAGYLAQPLKKTVSFTVEGEKEGFVTLLEAGRQTGKIRAVCCRDFQSLTVTEESGKSWEISTCGMEEKTASVRVWIRALPFADGASSGTDWASCPSVS